MARHGKEVAELVRRELVNSYALVGTLAVLDSSLVCSLLGQNHDDSLICSCARLMKRITLKYLTSS